jgi:hypothetical protein
MVIGRGGLYEKGPDISLCMQCTSELKKQESYLYCLSCKRITWKLAPPVPFGDDVVFAEECPQCATDELKQLKVKRWTEF